MSPPFFVNNPPKCLEVSIFLCIFAAMNDLINISSLIYEIRGQKVMLDFDLARMYGVETSQLKRSVRRNIERFECDDFMFEVTREELSRCQIGTLNVGQGHNIKYLPFAFTEMGVLCSVAFCVQKLHKPKPIIGFGIRDNK